MDDLPGYLWGSYTFRFELPHVGRECSLMPIPLMAEGFPVVSISGFEASLNETDVVLAGFIGRVNSRFVYYAADVTITVEWALVLPSAVTCARCLFWFRGQALEVVSTDNAFHIVHARIAYLHIVSVEQFMQFVITWEMLMRKRWATSVLTFMLNGGLNHVMLRFLFRFGCLGVSLWT